MKKDNDPFKFINAINSGQDITKDEDFDIKSYQPYMINRSLSYFSDTIIWANEMNANHHLDKQLQFDFLINIIRPRKRYAKKWAKPEKDTNVEVISEYFGYSLQKSKQAAAVLSHDDIQSIQNKINKGGLKK